MSWSDLLALATFVAVGAGSPGPNNTLLLASGIGFGFARTLPHVVGTTIGIALLVAIAAAGAGTLVTAVPAVELALKIAASAYLLLLAYRLARGFSVGQASVPEPFTVGRATAFQFINPKGWFFAFALVGAFAGSDGITIAEGVVTIGIVAVIVAATATGWAAGGSALSRRLHADRTRRIVGLALGVALAGSVAFLWI